MSQITIQCRLVASESTRQQLWKWMTEQNTPLINELLLQVRQHSDFETWRQKGKIPADTVKQMCKPLKTDPRFIGQPGRFYTSAIITVNYIYKSWLALMKESQNQLQGKTQWLEMLKSDAELVEASGLTLENLRAKAAEILAQIATQSDIVGTQQKKGKKGKKSKKSKDSDSERSVSKTLFKDYPDTEDILTRCAISYLLKNGCKVTDKEEDPEQFAKRRRKVEIQIERLAEQIKARIPKGRDLTDTQWLENLLVATHQVPESEAEAKSWQNSLLRKSSSLPFPVSYESSEDMTWFWEWRLKNIPINLCFFWLYLYIDYLIVFLFLHNFIKNEKNWFKSLRLSNSNLLIKLWNLMLDINCLAGLLFLSEARKKYKTRICVKLNGLGEYTFEVYCDHCQLHWFKRFLEDQKVKKESKKQHSSSLFTLRSGRIAWQQGESKGVRGSAATATPWNIHYLTLYCSVDTRLWTAEGTKLVIKEKEEKIAKSIKKTKEKGNLNDEQLAYLQRQNTTLAKINNPFPRPSKPLYQGQPHILLGVSLGLDKPATVAVVNVISNKVIIFRNIKQLLGKNYKLLNRQRQQKQVLSHQRKIAQTLAAPNQFGESELGQYIDRLLAKEIVALAQTYYAGSIVLPKLDNMREQVNSEIQARAEQKCPECIQAQKNYAKQYRISVNQWSYGRLIECIQTQASKVGIVIEEAKQPFEGSEHQKAKQLAICAYHSRKNG